MEGSFTVLTANVAGQEWMGFSTRKAAAYQVFRSLDSDIVGFQELGLANWEEVFGAARPDLEIVHGKQAGDIIINSFAYKKSRFEILGKDTLWLSPHGNYGPAWGGAERGFTWGWLYDRVTERNVLLVNAHLDNKSVEARIESILFILSTVNGFGDTPVVFVGDANVSIHSPRRDIWGLPLRQKPYKLMLDAGFTDVWSKTNSGTRPPTFHAFKGTKYNPLKDDEYGTADTDWIMVRGMIQPISCWLIKDSVDGVHPSDHFWVEATLLFK